MQIKQKADLCPSAAQQREAGQETWKSITSFLRVLLALGSRVWIVHTLRSQMRELKWRGFFYYFLLSFFVSG